MVQITVEMFIRLVLPLLLISCCFGQGIPYVKEHYTKYDYLIPMRDGVRLFTSVYVPKDSATTYPMLLTRTPYSVRPYGVDQYRASLGPSELFTKEGYIFVYQDVRGRFKSEGTFEQVRPHIANKQGPKDVDESSDTYDTIEYLLKAIAGHNGRAGMYGISYPGFYTSTGMIDAHPALKAVSPQAPVADWFIGDDFHHNGTLYLAHAFRWLWSNARENHAKADNNPLKVFDYESPDGYNLFLSMGTLSEINEKMNNNKVPFWNDMTRHPNYDAFWKARDIRPHLKAIKPAVMTVGGWFDAEDLFGTLETYRRVEKSSPGTFNILVMGPWHHGGWASGDGKGLGSVPFNAKTSEYYQKNVELPFFEFFLKDKKDPKLAEAIMFETGTNVWRSYPSWPPPGAISRSLNFAADSMLAWNAPSMKGMDEYVSDPSRPVPYVGYIANTMTREHMLDDQRFAATRPDVLVYQTPAVEVDTTLAGPLKATLYVSTTGTDSDFVVKLIDVYPPDYPDPDPNPANVHMGGYQQLIRGEPFRGKYRKSFETPEAFTPGKMEKIEFILPDVFHTFRPGHKIMIQVQSSWFPLVDRNPQKFVDIYNAKRSDFVKATERVYFGPGQDSRLEVMVMPTVGK